MNGIKITLISRDILTMNSSDFEVLELRTESIAKGKFFVHIIKNNHHYEISKCEFVRVSEILDSLNFAKG